MSRIIRDNLYELLKSEIRCFNILIDIGCGDLSDIVTFEKSPFKKLIGIDQKFETNPFGAYRRQIKLKQSVANSENDMVDAEVSDFRKRFDIKVQDFQLYNFQEKTLSLIICNKVLHFFNFEQQFELIRTSMIL